MIIYVVLMNSSYCLDYGDIGETRDKFLGIAPTFEKAKNIAWEKINEMYEQGWYGYGDPDDRHWSMNHGDDFALNEPFVVYHRDEGDYEKEHAEIVISPIELVGVEN